MLICLLPIEDKDFSITLKPEETQTVTMSTAGQPVIVETTEALAVWREDAQSWDEYAFLSYNIYLLPLEMMKLASDLNRPLIRRFFIY